MNQRRFRILWIAVVVVASMAVLWRVLTWLFRLVPWLALPLLLLTGIFLITLILIQKGKGGGLSGAFGGMGGQSAFGAKAGDVFTKITIGLAGLWIFLCILSARALTPVGDGMNLGTSSTAAEEQTLGEEQSPLGGADDTAGNGASEEGDEGPGEDSPS